eukprot:TRINITY_DN7717_c0_g6_i1.p1 TRINITY_DN7717_c0_g6~~TRINITY_DN7717_c0_g6_i1.p1  ORF type:complete len:335 (-),score=40.54 TRINITY_DN7717_c0_g6_i1:131-1135(-)
MPQAMERNTRSSVRFMIALGVLRISHGFGVANVRSSLTSTIDITKKDAIDVNNDVAIRSVPQVTKKVLFRKEQGVTSIKIATLLSWRDRFEQDSKIFDGCKHIFLDVGSNRGTHIRKLFEASKYSNAAYLSQFDTAFGAAEQRAKPSSESQICAFGFEANPRWAPVLDDVEKAYSKMGWRAMWFAPVAVSDASGNDTLYTNDHGDNSDWGFSEVKTNDVATPVKDSKLDFGDFVTEMQKHIQPGGYKLVKMDVEGAEFDIMTELMDHKLLCADALDRMTIEWHDRFFKAAKLDYLGKVHARVENGTRCAPLKNTDVEEIDDESYLNDGVPLPGS